MTDEQINIAIAKACGWKFIADYCHGADQPPEYTTVTPDGRHLCGYYPEYCTDLNAMHEAEIAMFKSDGLLWHKYASCLDEDYVNQPYTIGATARQRAEAYLKTIEKCIK